MGIAALDLSPLTLTGYFPPDRAAPGEVEKEFSTMLFASFLRASHLFALPGSTGEDGMWSELVVNALARDLAEQHQASYGRALLGRAASE